MIAVLLRRRILELCPSTTKKGLSRQAVSNPYKNSFNDIEDEPGFATAIREVEEIDGSIISDRTASNVDVSHTGSSNNGGSEHDYNKDSVRNKIALDSFAN